MRPITFLTTDRVLGYWPRETQRIHVPWGCRCTGWVCESLLRSIPLTSTKGCNLLWDLSGPKPTCSGTTSVPVVISSSSATMGSPTTFTTSHVTAHPPATTITSTSTPPMTGFTLVGCVADAPNGRLLTAAQTTSTMMTAF